MASFEVEVFHEFPSLEKLRSGAKRHAIYIPQSFFDKARQALALEADAGSTWEFSAASTPPLAAALLENTSSMPSSPAQEIVVRYRAGVPIQWEEPSIQPVPPIEGQNHGGGGWAAYLNIAEVSGQIQPSFKRNEGAETSFVRPQCGQTISRREKDRSIREDDPENTDLTVRYQLIHSNASERPEDFWLFFLKHDDLLSCSRCHHVYDCQYDIDIHRCTVKRVWPFGSRFKVILTRILSKLSRCN